MSISFAVRGLQPRSFTKIAYSDTLFEVSWLDPVNRAEVDGYTVYWCRTHNNRDRPYQVEKQYNMVRIFLTIL